VVLNVRSYIGLFSIENGYGQKEGKKQYTLFKEKQFSQSICRQEELLLNILFLAVLRKQQV
jgi:hypothetical protein